MVTKLALPLGPDLQAVWVAAEVRKSRRVAASVLGQFDLTYGPRYSLRAT